MVEYYLNVEDVISDFLRTFMIDPRNRAEDSISNTFSATASQTIFEITPTVGSVSCITKLTVNGSEKTKWKDYFWDYQNSKVTFYDALTLADVVIVTFKQGITNWIYSDRPDEALKDASFPRISIFTTGGGGNKIGGYKADIDSKPSIQIDCWAKIAQPFTIDGRKYSNEYLGRYLGNKVVDAFDDNEDVMFGVFYDFDLVGYPRGGPYSEEYAAHHTVVEVRVKGLHLGRIIK